jgi:hypothetical protein
LLQVDAQHVQRRRRLEQEQILRVLRENNWVVGGGCGVGRPYKVEESRPLGHACDGCLASAKSPSSDARPDVTVQQSVGTKHSARQQHWSPCNGADFGKTRALRIEHSCRAYDNRNCWPSISSSEMSSCWRSWRSARGRPGPAELPLLGAFHEPQPTSFMRSPQIQEEATLRRFEK